MDEISDSPIAWPDSLNQSDPNHQRIFGAYVGHVSTRGPTDLNEFISANPQLNMPIVAVDSEPLGAPLTESQHNLRIGNLRRRFDMGIISNEQFLYELNQIEEERISAREERQAIALSEEEDVPEEATIDDAPLLRDIRAHRWDTGPGSIPEFTYEYRYQAPISPIRIGTINIQTEPERNEMITAQPKEKYKLPKGSITYLEALQSQTGRMLDQDEWEIFAEITKKNDINKMFFALPEKKKGIKPTKERINAIKNEYKKHAQEQKAKRIRDNERAIQNSLDSASAYTRDATTQLNKLGELRRDHALILEIEIDIEKSIIEACENKFWSLHEMTSNALIFKSNDIILSDKNAKAGVNLTVNLGSMFLHMRFPLGQILVKPAANNFFYRSYYHPHLNVTGEPCYGNTQQSIIQALGAHRINDALVIMQNLLTTYNSDSPFIGLKAFGDISDPEFLAKARYSFIHKKNVRLIKDAFEKGFAPEQYNAHNNVHHNGKNLKELHECKVYEKINEQYGVSIDNKLYLRDKKENYFEFTKEQQENKELVHAWI